MTSRIPPAETLLKLHVSKRDRFDFLVTHVARFDGFDKLPLSHDADVLGAVEIVSRHQHRCPLLAEHFDQLGKLIRSLEGQGPRLVHPSESRSHFSPTQSHADLLTHHPL